jgi:uncharacterized protein (DUF2141 family)
MKMKSVASLALVAALAAGAAMPASATAIGPHAARCESGAASVIVNVTGFRVRTGSLRVQIYASNQRTYLERRQWLTRVDLPVTRSGDMPVCMPVSAAGRYLVSVRHDVNGNGDSDRSDGGGFSGNPNVSVLDMVFRRKPNLNRISFTVADEPVRVNVVLNYVNGTRFEPVNRS